VRRDAARKGGSADDGRVARYVMEAARLYPFPIGLYRHCRDRTQVDTGSGRQRTIPADATVLALTIAADTDRRFAPHPGSFLVGRPERQSLVFGTGQHHCAGATEERPIAPTLMTEMATALFALPGVRRIGGRGTPSQQFKKGISVEYEGAPS